MASNYERAFGFLESAVHRALRELDDTGYPLRRIRDARTILRSALNDLQNNHGIELHWPDVKEKQNASS